MAVAFFLGAAAIIDFKTKKLKNFFPLAITVLSVFCWIWQGEVVLWRQFVGPLLAIFFGFIAFQFKLLGAGDSKLLAAIFLILPYTQHLTFLGLLALTGLLYIIGRKIVILCWGEKRADRKFSYGPVIFLSWLWMGFILKL